MKKYYDLFNGDADGIVSLHQYRMHFPQHSELITGVKRDVELLRHVTGVKDSCVTVFDVSHKTNKEHARQVLANNDHLVWFDNHQADMYIPGPGLSMNIDTSPDCCTSMLVDSHVDGLYRPWTIVGAYGDNLHDSVKEMCPLAYLDDHKLTMLQEIGETLNYNGYGNVESDLTVHPKDVYIDMSDYESPFDYRNQSPIYDKIYHQKCMDSRELEASDVLHQCDVGRVVLLPDSKASVRFSGIYSNRLSLNNPDQAFVILTSVDDDTYRVSIRAPYNRPNGASSLAENFPTGGGRERAAGVNSLPKNKLRLLIDLMKAQFAR